MACRRRKRRSSYDSYGRKRRSTHRRKRKSTSRKTKKLEIHIKHHY